MYVQKIYHKGAVAAMLVEKVTGKLGGKVIGKHGEVYLRWRGSFLFIITHFENFASEECVATFLCTTLMKRFLRHKYLDSYVPDALTASVVNTICQACSVFSCYLILLFITIILGTITATSSESCGSAARANWKTFGAVQYADAHDSQSSEWR